MTNVNHTCINFVGGELAPSLNARSDIKVYSNGCARIENFILETVGPAKYRTGTRFVNSTRRNTLGRLIPFQFSDEQAYLVECTPGYFRFYKDEGIIIYDGLDITNVTIASKGVFTSSKHGLSNGDKIYISGLEGTVSALNNQAYTVADKTDNTFTLKDSNNAAVSTSGLTYTSGGHIGNRNVSAVSVSTGVFTVIAHQLNNGDEIFIDDLSGTIEALNGQSFIVSDITADTFKLVDEDDNYIDISDLTYTSGGFISRIYEITNPYSDISDMSDEEIMDYLHKIQFAQNADTSYFVHPQYAPRKLMRTGHSAWTFNTFTRTSDPFTGVGKYPRSVCFDGAGRLIYGGTDDDPEMLMMSRGPNASTGEQRYDDFTTGNLANDALKLFLNPSQGKVESIQWLAANDRYFLVGTFSGVRRVVSSDGYDSAFSATTGVLVKPIDSYGCESVKPIPRGNSLFYIQRGGLILRCLEYNLYYDSYKATDKNLVSDMILDSGVREIVFQQSRPDVLWHVRKDGKLIGLTYHESEDIAGWHRHIIGGTDCKVISAGIMPRKDNGEQLWLIVERFINGKTRRYVEFMTDFIKFKTPEDFYTDEENRDTDILHFQNDLYQRQKLETHLDSCLTYNGSKLGLDSNATLTIGTINSSNNVATVTSNVSLFSSSDVDREIWRIHDEDGIGSGRMRIVAFDSSTQIQCLIVSDFDKKILSPGEWALTTSRISGLQHLEGETVSIVTDGALHNNAIVENGKVVLDNQADVVHIGFSYRGLLKTMNIQAGGVTGSAQNKLRHVQKVVFEFMNTLGAYFGTDLYDLSKVAFRKMLDRTNRPSPLYTGGKREDVRDDTSDRKHCYVVQDTPLPCTIQAIDIFMETIDE